VGLGLWVAADERAAERRQQSLAKQQQRAALATQGDQAAASSTMGTKERGIGGQLGACSWSIAYAAEAVVGRVGLALRPTYGWIALDLPLAAACPPCDLRTQRAHNHIIPAL
jgi:hypothetical protein